MYGILGFRFLRRQVELFQNELVSLGVIFDPLSDGDLESPVIHVVEYPSSGLVLIGTDERALSAILVTLFTVLSFPYVLVHFGTGYSSV